MITPASILAELEEGKKIHVAELKKKTSAGGKDRHKQAIKNIETKIQAVNDKVAKAAEMPKALLNSQIARDVSEMKEEIAELQETVAKLSMLMPAPAKAPTQPKAPAKP